MPKQGFKRRMDIYNYCGMSILASQGQNTKLPTQLDQIRPRVLIIHSVQNLISLTMFEPL